MSRTDAAAWVLSVGIGCLRAWQAKTLAAIVTAALGAPRLTPVRLDRQKLGMSQRRAGLHPQETAISCVNWIAQGTMLVSEHTASVPAGIAGSDRFIDRHHHLLRRLHSLTGIIPVGVFVIEHLITNASVLHSPEEFQHAINFIYSLPGLLMMEIFGIWLPILFHGALGMVYVFTGTPNTRQYAYGANVRYTLMRVTGMIAVVFIIVHVSTTRWGWTYGGLLDTPFDPNHAVASTATALQAYPWVAWFYVIGTLSIVFHLSNGLWTAAITWGLTITEQAQRRWGYVCVAIGVALALAGLGAIYRFSTLDLNGLARVVPGAH